MAAACGKALLDGPAAPWRSNPAHIPILGSLCRPSLGNTESNFPAEFFLQALSCFVQVSVYLFLFLSCGLCMRMECGSSTELPSSGAPSTEH